MTESYLSTTTVILLPTTFATSFDRLTVEVWLMRSSGHCKETVLPLLTGVVPFVWLIAFSLVGSEPHGLLRTASGHQSALPFGARDHEQGFHRQQHNNGPEAEINTESQLGWRKRIDVHGDSLSERGGIAGLSQGIRPARRKLSEPNSFSGEFHKENTNIDAPDAIATQSQPSSCTVPVVVDKAVLNPTWTASYPGSGAKLSWKLIRAITGIFTGDDHDHNGRVANKKVVAVKTHWPSHTPQEVVSKTFLRSIRRAILLIRNPLHSIPSYHNFVYEQVNGLRNHSVRAPIEAWIKWRNEFFASELKAWIEHQRFWLTSFHREEGRFHLLCFEHLTSDEKGVETLRQMGAFLASGGKDIAEGMISVDQLPCVWDMYVKGNVPGEKDRRKSHRQGGPTVYPFTSEQLDQIIDSIQGLKSEFTTFPLLQEVLDEYIGAAREEMDKIGKLVAQQHQS